MEPNTHYFTFTVHLGESLPPSLFRVKGAVPHIDYFLAVNGVCSDSDRSFYQKLPIVIMPNIPRPLNDSIIEQKESISDLCVNGQLLRNYLPIGERFISLKLHINNPSRSIIKEGIVKLVQQRQLKRHYGEAIIFKDTLAQIINFRDESLQETFEIPVPTLDRSLAPSSTYNSSETPNAPWVVSYTFEVKLKTALFSKNLVLKFPIMVVNSNV